MLLAAGLAGRDDRDCPWRAPTRLRGHDQRETPAADGVADAGALPILGGTARYFFFFFFAVFFLAVFLAVFFLAVFFLAAFLAIQSHLLSDVTCQAIMATPSHKTDLVG